MYRASGGVRGPAGSVGRIRWVSGGVGAMGASRGLGMYGHQGPVVV